MAGNKTLDGKNGVFAMRMLRRISRILEKENIPYILEAGTLLGIVRENRLLPWDNDVDITITRQFEDQLLKSLWKIRLLGYKVQAKYYHRDLKYFKKGELRIVKIKHKNPLRFFKTDVILDIFIKRKINKEYYWTVGINAPVLKSVPEEFYDFHTQIEFKGKKYSVPENYEGYLENHYGKNWRTPIKEWDYRTSDQSVREFL